jgi:hypothetical protein
MKIIMYGENVEGMAAALRAALRYQREDGMPSGRLMGLRIAGVVYSVKWGKASITVREQS